MWSLQTVTKGKRGSKNCQIEHYVKAERSLGVFVK